MCASQLSFSAHCRSAHSLIVQILNSLLEPLIQMYTLASSSLQQEDKVSHFVWDKRVLFDRHLITLF